MSNSGDIHLSAITVPPTRSAATTRHLRLGQGSSPLSRRRSCHTSFTPWPLKGSHNSFPAFRAQCPASPRLLLYAGVDGAAGVEHVRQPGNRSLEARSLGASHASLGTACADLDRVITLTGSGACGKIITNRREPLGVPGEVVWRGAVVQCPRLDAAATATAVDLRSYASVQPVTVRRSNRW